jgi:hypothetical protein
LPDINRKYENTKVAIGVRRAEVGVRNMLMRKSEKGTKGRKEMMIDAMKHADDADFTDFCLL